MIIVLCVLATVFLLELVVALWIIVRQREVIQELEQDILEKMQWCIEFLRNGKEAEEEDPADWWKKKEEKIQNG